MACPADGGINHHLPRMRLENGKDLFEQDRAMLARWCAAPATKHGSTLFLRLGTGLIRGTFPLPPNPNSFYDVHGLDQGVGNLPQSFRDYAHDSAWINALAAGFLGNNPHLWIDCAAGARSFSGPFRAFTR